MLNDIERPDLDSDSKNSINKRSESAKEKHARNELLILSAAIKFKETSSDIFNEKCLKKMGATISQHGPENFPTECTYFLTDNARSRALTQLPHTLVGTLSFNCSSF
ncbi:hypothetical protein IE981_19820 [Klebsiella pneumoniae]|nr:hypothetical protein [Klebsiella pneumoniae]